MPKLFIFAIGGTGERVMRSFTMLMAAGIPALNNYDVYPIIIDYDQKNADKLRTVELLQNYANVHNAAYKRHTQGIDQEGVKSLFFSSKPMMLSGLKEYVFPFKPATPNQKFREYIGFDFLAGDTLLTRHLLASLYDESHRADTELNLDMTVGFKGNPNIGSVVFNSIGNTAEFSTFRSLFNPSQGDKAVIIGSLFGGTGASGIPEIVKAINAMQNQAKIATIFVLPYFAPMEQKGGAIRASRFNSKTKAALSFYKDSGLMPMIDKIYYIGDPYPTSVPYSEGGDTQQNTANLVELLAAMMIEHYVANRGGTQQEFKFSLNANIVVRDGQKNGNRLFLEDFDPVSVKEVLNHLVELSIGLKFFHEEIHSEKAKSRDFYKYLKLDAKGSNKELDTLCEELEKFYHKYQNWLKELDYDGNGKDLPGNSHRFALCDMTKKYPDMLLRAAGVVAGESGSLMDKAKGLFGSNSKVSLSEDYLYARMDYHMSKDKDGKGHYDTAKNALRDNAQPEWVFAEILHGTSADGFKKLTESTSK